MQDVTVIFRRRGGDDLEQNHTRWARTVRSSPDVIEMTFFPIAALLEGVIGKEHLTRAIGLYLECKKTETSSDGLKLFLCSIMSDKVVLLTVSKCLLSDKPPIEELRYFLEFQISRIWSPVYDRNLAQQRKEPVCPALQFSIMGQKLYVSQEQVRIFFVAINTFSTERFELLGGSYP